MYPLQTQIIIKENSAGLLFLTVLGILSIFGYFSGAHQPDVWTILYLLIFEECPNESIPQAIDLIFENHFEAT